MREAKYIYTLHPQENKILVIDAFNWWNTADAFHT